MNKFAAHDIRVAILNGNFNLDELREINQAVKLAYDLAARKGVVTFKVGDRVRNEKYGFGHVEKIAQKNVFVRLDSGERLRAAPSLLVKA